ncbi:MAG: hypothetical protein QXT25_02460 [Candidatus Anstonellaceae archaeon]
MGYVALRRREAAFKIATVALEVDCSALWARVTSATRQGRRALPTVTAAAALHASLIKVAMEHAIHVSAKEDIAQPKFAAQD